MENSHTGWLHRRFESPRDSLGRVDLGLILAIAALPRLAGLGHVSLWLDEILSSLRVGRNLAEAWAAWKGNPVHPPLSEFLQWLWFRVVEPEPLRRMLPVALGIMTVVLLARLACRWFGRRAAWATALIAALSPLHVRYSQELRGYSLGLLALVLALVASELAFERRSWSGWAILGLALSLCYWSMYISAMALVPIVLTMLQTTAGRPTWRRELTGFALALVSSVVLFAPWFSVARRAATKVHERQATEWTWSLAGNRWQFLTAGGVEGAPLSAGAVLFAVLLAAGIVAAAASSRGRSVIAGALAGSVGVEVVLWLTDHWSNGRYNLASWPFLVMLAGLGCARVYDLVIRLSPTGGRAGGKGGRCLGGVIAALSLLAMLLFQTAGLADYFRRGRPDWHSVARVASAMAVPDRPILVGNERTRISLGYYLAQREGSRRADVSTRVQGVGSSVEAAELTGRGCATVVDSWWPKTKAFDELLLETPAQRDFPRSGARVAAIGDRPSPKEVEIHRAAPWSCLPEAIEEAAGERPSPRFLRVLERRGHPHGLEFAVQDQPRLRYGWSYAERTPGGMTFRWAVGRWAAIDLPTLPATTLRLEVWSLFEDQIMSVYLGRQLLASYPLATTKQTIEVPLPVPQEGGKRNNVPEGDRSDAGPAGEEILVFEFSRYASAQENPRPLAVAFDRVELNKTVAKAKQH